jgi:hypothetical protein
MGTIAIEQKREMQKRKKSGDVFKMSRLVNRKSLLSMLIAFAIAVGFAGGSASAQTAHTQSAAKNNPLCARLGKTFQGSSGMQMWCFGPQPNGSVAHKALPKRSGSFSRNVNAANPAEDVSPSGVQAFGQSETSIAAIGPYAVEAWNDSTGFFAPCPSPMNKEETLGFGFSANRGKTFTDKGGYPNANCNQFRYSSDPSVEAWQSGGNDYFYMSGMYDPVFSSSGPPPDNRSFVAVTACKASGTGSTALLSCGQPTTAATSSQCRNQGNNFFFCGFLDKDDMTIDPVHGRLYLSYTEFFINFQTLATTSIIEMAVCDIGTPTGGTGPAGGTAGKPVCFNDSLGSQSNPAPPYMTIADTDPRGCENEGAYPAVDLATGDVYIAYEHNWATNIFLPSCASEPTQDVLNYIPFSCLPLAPQSACARPTAKNGVSLTSMDAAFIPGYNRFPMSDFPRIAVSDVAGTVSIVWNDARFHPTGDILLQSFKLARLTGVQTEPVVINSDTGGWHFMPGLHNTDANGNLNIGFYDRASPNTSVTDVVTALAVSPTATSTPTNSVVTDVSSDWNSVSSIIIPNFGDYTDTYVISTPGAPYTGTRLYVAWSDGRIGDPQPFEANAPV